MGMQQTMRALSDPTRREILNLLKAGRMATGNYKKDKFGKQQ